MIRLFRKIRQKLLTDSSYGMYILYASGEIILVMVGILLALQVDKWTENRKENELEKSTLLNLREEFQDNINSLNQTIEKRNSQLYALNQIFELIDNPFIEAELSNLDSLIGLSRYIPNFEPRSGVIDETLSSGKLNIIESFEIREFLSNWSGELEDLRRKEDGLQHVVLENFNPYLIKNHTLRNSDNHIVANLWDRSNFSDPKWRLSRSETKFKLDYTGIITDPAFESLISLLNIWVVSGQKSSVELKEKINRIIEIIDRNIDQL